MEPHNVIWIMVDGIRNYPDYEDSCHVEGWPESESIGKMGLLPVMEEVAKDGIEFKNAICSATSTAMSISSQMMGIPAYYISRNFDDFKYDRHQFNSLSDVLKDNGYHVYGLSFAIDVRIKFKGIINHIGKDLWPKGLNKYVAWNNDAVTGMFENLIKKGMKSPFFLYIHLNGRFDDNISDRVKDIINRLRSISVYDNSIVILNSDHGMPDPHPERSQSYYEWMKKYNIPKQRHDMVMSDDNILIPLIMKYPGSPVKKIETQVGAIDIYYTILDILGIKYKGKFADKCLGRSFLPLIKGDEVETFRVRKFRTDARYITQTENITSIRGNRFKYIRADNCLNMEREQFFDLENDPFEKNNLVQSDSEYYRNKLNEYVHENEKQENDATIFQEQYLGIKLRDNLHLIEPDLLKKTKRILILGTCEASFLNMFIKCCEDIFHNPELHVVHEKGDKVFVSTSAGSHIMLYKLRDVMKGETIKSFADANKNKYDIVFVLLNNKFGKGYKGYKVIVNNSKNLNFSRLILCDYNCDLYRSLYLRYTSILIEKIRFNKQRYFRKPTEIFVDVKRLLTGSINI